MRIVTAIEETVLNLQLNKDPEFSTESRKQITASDDTFSKLFKAECERLRLEDEKKRNIKSFTSTAYEVIDEFNKESGVE